MLVVFGTVCIDSVRRVPVLPSTGGYVEVVEEQRFLGGEAANTARHLKGWGVPVSLAGNALGSGDEGLELLELVRQAGLPDRCLSVGRGVTPVCDIYVTPDGDRTMFGHGFSAMDWPQAVESFEIRPGEWFTAEPNMPLAARAAARKANYFGMKIYLMDFVRDDEPVPEGGVWQASTDWVGVRGDRDANVKVVAETAARYACHAILTDGSFGLAYAPPKGPGVWLPAFPAPAIVDSTGAGDAFRAGVLSHLHDGRPMAEALAFGAAAGSLACGFAGAAEKTPSFDEVQNLLAAHPEVWDVYRTTLCAG